MLYEFEKLDEQIKSIKDMAVLLNSYSASPMMISLFLDNVKL
jgi:hypothetical protein